MKIVLKNSSLVFQQNNQRTLTEYEVWDGLVNSEGGTSATSSYKSIAWAITGGKTHICSCSRSGLNESAASGWNAISYFDSSKNYISGITLANVTSSGTTWEDFQAPAAPANAAYMVIPNSSMTQPNSSVIEIS